MDDDIYKNYLEKVVSYKKESIFLKTLKKIFSLLFVTILLTIICLNLTGVNKENLTQIYVVNSNSMSKKNPNNQYLFLNNLNNQFNTYDVIFTSKLPKEEKLKLYDIVLYKIDGLVVVHRIVKIEKVNVSGEVKTYFTLKGDALEHEDTLPVLYEQMISIYKGKKVPFVGSFIVFLKSPCGILVFLLVIFYIFGYPICNRKINCSISNRLDTILKNKK